MKQLFALSALLIPIYLFAQGFGSFSHDQPYLAADRSSGGGSTPNFFSNVWLKLDYNIGVGSTNLVDGATLQYWTNQGSAGGDVNVAVNNPYWLTTFIRNTNIGFGQTIATYQLKQPWILMSVMRVIRNSTGQSAILGDFGGDDVTLGPATLGDGRVNLFAGANLLSTGKVYTNDITNFFLLTVIASNGASSLRINGTEVKAGNAGANSIGNGATDGVGFGKSTFNSGSFVHADYQRYVIFTNLLSSTDLTNAEWNCITNFGLVF